MQSRRQAFLARIIPLPIRMAMIWVRQNLLSSWFNTILTAICLVAIALLIRGMGHWIFFVAQWEVVRANLRLLLVGRYPVEQLWRLWLVLGLLASVKAFSWGALQGWKRNMAGLVGGVGVGLMGLAVIAQAGWVSVGWLVGITLGVIGAGSLGNGLRRQSFWPALQAWLPLFWLMAFLAMLWLIGGGWGLATVGTTFWNGLLLTLWVAVLSIVLSFPLGVLLALGRQSPLPVVRNLSIAYIEIIRGLPLIGILFMAQVMLPLLLPPQIAVDQLVRAIAGLTLFSAAYLAETVRGGLQSIPKGQWEASQALGLSPPLMLGLVILPQALRAVIPAIVGQFIGLFKDTALLSIVGLVELTGIARSIAAQPEYLGRYAEVYLAIGLVYWIFCYGMSVSSRRLEHHLGQQA